MHTPDTSIILQKDLQTRFCLSWKKSSDTYPWINASTSIYLPVAIYLSRFNPVEWQRQYERQLGGQQTLSSGKIPAFPWHGWGSREESCRVESNRIESMTNGCHLFQGSARCPGRLTCWSARWRCWCCASAWASARHDTSPRTRTRILCAFDNRDTPSRFTPTPRRRRPRSPLSRSVDRAWRCWCALCVCVSMREHTCHRRPSTSSAVAVVPRNQVYCTYRRAYQRPLAWCTWLVAMNDSVREIS